MSLHGRADTTGRGRCQADVLYIFVYLCILLPVFKKAKSCPLV